MKILLLILLFSFHSALACDIHLPHQMVIFSDEPSGKNIFKATECDVTAINDLHHIISGLEGRVASFQLKELMASRKHNVAIDPQSVVIHQFKTLIREQLQLPSGVQVKTTRSINFPGILSLPAGDQVEVTCSACLYGTQQSLNVSIIGFDGTKQNMNASADFKKLVKAYRLISPLPAFSTLTDAHTLKEEYIESIPHTDLLTEIETLKFYKTNKPLKAGELLKKSDLNALNLVKAGLKTEVVLENQMIRIKTQGISRSNGAIGELVEVFHPQKNKKYQGKVIDINKVLVEL